MKNKVSLSKLVTVLAFVFVFIFGIMGTNAWLTDFDDDSRKAGFVVTIGTVDASILGNSTQGSTTYTTDLSTNGFELPANLKPGSFTQYIRVKNNETTGSGIYTRIKFIVRCNGADVTSQNYITTNTSWTYSSSTGWYTYSGTVAANSIVNFCTSMTVSSSLPQGQVVQVVIVMEGASTNAF